ncbi:Gfo/Idh/MocA family oxidoreductase [Candidatus Bathyarchaeota archaeon]|nr:Gfo/Idh/MocA family oxidoreductase [Candidatus Bathyarchaeota archaeon]
MSKVSVGVIGCGWIANMTHLPILSERIPEARLVAVADNNKEKAKNAAKKYRADFWYTDYKELLNNPKIDAVWICTPPHLHAPMVIEAANAGKHVMCEIPMTTTLEKADAMIAAAKSNGAKLMLGYCFHFGPIYLETKKLIEKGEIGMPVMISYKLFVPRENWGAGKPWVKNLGEGGHIDINGTEPIDFMLFLSNYKVRRVYSEAGTLAYRDKGNTEDNLAMLLWFDEGAIGIIEYSTCIVEELTMDQADIIGDAGSISIENNHFLTLYKRDAPQQRQWSFKPLYGKPSWGHYEEDSHFIKCIIENKKPRVTGDYGRNVLKIALASIESRKKRKPINVEI